jgi:hypothetical protein
MSKRLFWPPGPQKSLHFPRRLLEMSKLQTQGLSFSALQASTPPLDTYFSEGTLFVGTTTKCSGHFKELRN